jgi:hypothetical protein
MELTQAQQSAFITTLIRAVVALQVELNAMAVSLAGSRYLPFELLESARQNGADQHAHVLEMLNADNPDELLPELGRLFPTQ